MLDVFSLTELSSRSPVDVANNTWIQGLIHDHHLDDTTQVRGLDGYACCRILLHSAVNQYQTTCDVPQSRGRHQVTSDDDAAASRIAQHLALLALDCSFSYRVKGCVTRTKVKLLMTG
jgi:hypothetical protein